ncbi:discoidin domain-containing protein [Streptomyces sp. NPDC002513]
MLQTNGERITVALRAQDPVSQAGVTSQLRTRPEIKVIEWEEGDAPQVVVVVLDAVDEDALRLLRQIQRTSTARGVLVTTHIDEQQPRLHVWRRPRLTLPVFLIVLVVAAWLARALLTELFTFAEDNSGTPKPLRPAHMRASSQAASHRAQAAFDGLNNRYWAPAAPGPATGQYLEADFERPVRLQKILITSGSSTKPDEYLSQARPSEITLTLVSSDGKHTT